MELLVSYVRLIRLDNSDETNRGVKVKQAEQYRRKLLMSGGGPSKVSGQ